MRSQFENSTHKDPLEADYMKGGHHSDGAYLDRNQPVRSDVELDVQVQVEHTVTVDYLPTAYEREQYRPPRSSRSGQWDRDGLSR